MLILKLSNETATEATYNYYPEGKEEYGVLIVDKNNGDISVKSIAPGDEFRRYLGHAVPKLEELFKKNSYESKILVAWY